MSFDRLTPVLHFSPRALPLRFEKSQWLLWPAYGYQVIVPVPRKRPFNLFQEHVIKLCRAGVRYADDIGKRLGLGTDLAAFICLELKQMGMLDDDGCLTERALKEIEDAEVAPCDAVSGFIFQDVSTGAIWPRFAAGSLPKAGLDRVMHDPDFDALRFDLVLGTTGNPEYPRAVAYVPDRLMDPPPVPSARAILVACREHRRHEQNHRRACGRDLGGDTDREIAGFDLPAVLAEVSLVTKNPQPVFLTSFLFVPEDEVHIGAWQICDPFGLGPSLPLRKQIEEVITHSSAPLLWQLIQRLAERSYAVNPVNLNEDRAANQREALDAVNRELGQEIRSYVDLHRRLVELEKSLIAARPHTGRSDGSQTEFVSRFKDFLDRAYRAMEELFDVVLSQYPVGASQFQEASASLKSGDTLAALSEVAEENAELLGKIAARIGLHDSPQPVFQSFFRISRAQAKYIVSHDGRRLQSQFAVIVATARDVPNHPLCRLAGEFSDCVTFLLGLKQKRDGGSAHAGDALVREDLLPLRIGVYRMVRGLLPGMASAPDNVAGVERGPSDVAAGLNHQRLRARAALAIRQRLGQDVRTRSAIYARLLDMQTRLEELSVPTDEWQEDRELVAGDLLREGCACVEAALAELSRSAQPSAISLSLARDKRENARRFIETAREIGFELQGGQLPDDFVIVPTDRIEKTMRFHSGTLNSLTLALLWAAASQLDHPFRLVARARASFLLEIAELSARRGHLDRPRISPAEAAPLAGLILDLVETVLRYVS